MPNHWTSEQALALAPDENARKNALGLALPQQWLRLGQSEEGIQQIIWGEIQGSGADPYRVKASLDGPQLSCTCPSKKRPCKHALGLLLLFTGQPDHFESGAAPDWVAAWLTKRAESEARRAARAGDDTAEDPGKSHPAGGRSPITRGQERDARIRAGLDELETWLCDLLRQGLAVAQAQPGAFWETAAARLVDAQASGLARLVRALPALAASGNGWQERVLDQIARLTLAIEGYRRIDQLDEATQADLRSLVGITIRQQELLQNPGVQDEWLVLGKMVEEETNLKVQRTWLAGKNSGRSALVLSFAAPGSGLDPSLVPGTLVPGELVFYPGALPLRAVFRERGTIGQLPRELPGFDGWLTATGAYACALAAYPWLERYPLALNGMVPFAENGVWYCADREGRRAPLAKAFQRGWTLLALSGGKPLGLFGEWDGETLLPLSAWADGQFCAFPPNLG